MLFICWLAYVSGLEFTKSILILSLYLGWRLPRCGAPAMYRNAAEEGRPLTISYNDADEHVLVVMVRTYPEVKFGDFSIMLTLQPAPTKSKPRRCAWGVIHTGYIDINSMFVPRMKRKICYRQLPCLVLFGPGDLDVNHILNAYSGCQDCGPRSLRSSEPSSFTLALTTCQTWCTTRWRLVN